MKEDKSNIFDYDFTSVGIDKNGEFGLRYYKVPNSKYVYKNRILKHPKKMRFSSKRFVNRVYSNVFNRISNTKD